MNVLQVAGDHAEHAIASFQKNIVLYWLSAATAHASGNYLRIAMQFFLRQLNAEHSRALPLRLRTELSAGADRRLSTDL